MIFLMSQKQWNKNKKKLVVPKDYIIFDATADEDAKMSSYTNVVTMDGFNPPSKLVKLVLDDEDEDIIDFDKVEKLEKEFFNGFQFKQMIMATIAGVIENGDVNIFIVLRNKVFKIYKKRIKKIFEKMFPTDFEFIEIFSGETSDHKRSLKYNFSRFEMDELKSILKKREKQASTDYDKYKKKRKHW